MCIDHNKPLAPSLRFLLYLTVAIVDVKVSFDIVVSYVVVLGLAIAVVNKWCRQRNGL